MGDESLPSLDHSGSKLKLTISLGQGDCTGVELALAPFLSCPSDGQGLGWPPKLMHLKVDVN